MSVSLWAYDEDKCDGDYCPGNCDICRKAEPIDPEEEYWDRYNYEEEHRGRKYEDEVI